MLASLILGRENVVELSMKGKEKILTTLSFLLAD